MVCNYMWPEDGVQLAENAVLSSVFINKI